MLRQAGYEFVVRPATVDEQAQFGKLPPVQLALFLAKAKGEQISGRFGYEVTLAADTVVAFGDTPLGTPQTEQEAREMIELLSGTTHVVVTGVSIRCPARDIDLDCTALSGVRMRVMSNQRIDEYVASGRWQGKAGGYGIQDTDPIVTCIGGSISNVIGLPMEQTRELLQKAGIGPKDGSSSEKSA